MLQDEGWYAAAQRYAEFIRRHQHLHILFLELGVGMNTPVIIKYPFWQMTAQNTKAVYACVNLEASMYPAHLEGQTICLEADISETLTALREAMSV